MVNKGSHSEFSIRKHGKLSDFVFLFSKVVKTCSHLYVRNCGIVGTNAFGVFTPARIIAIWAVCVLEQRKGIRVPCGCSSNFVCT